MRARVDLAMKVYSVFSKAPALEPHHQILSSHSGHSLGKGSYSSAEMQLVYSTALADWLYSYMVSCIFIKY